MLRLVSLFLFLLLSLIVSSRKCDGIPHPRRERIIAQHGAVASDHGQCSIIGRDVLKQGGHAVDAAVAVALCLGVISPASSGIGGGAFMLIRSNDGNAEAYDMRETAPRLASQNMYRGNDGRKASGVLSIAIPGELAGLHDAWTKHGKIPWKKLVRPAARLASNGFKISPYLHMQMTISESGIMADKGLREIFTSNGSLLKADNVCYNRKLAKTLTLISRYGKNAFYNGSIGSSLVDDIRNAGGILTMGDLKNYQVKIREPIAVDVMGVKVLGMPPPSSGGAAISLILNILRGTKGCLIFLMPL